MARYKNKSKRAYAPPPPPPPREPGAWSDRSIAKAGMWISAVAALAAIVALALQYLEINGDYDYKRRQAEPELNVNFSNSAGRFILTINSIGVGDAKLKWFEALVDGSVVPTWDHWVSALGHMGEAHYENFHVPIPGVYARGFSGVLLQIPSGPLERLLWQQRGRMNFRMCYCSIFDECFISSGVEETEKVKACGAKSPLRFYAPSMDP